MGQKDLSGRSARWSLKLQQFNFSMEHRKGTLSVVPDTLSRFDVDELKINCNPPNIDLASPEFNSSEYEELRAKIRQDQELLPDLCLSDNFIYKRVKFRNNVDAEEDHWRLWLPKTLIRYTIKSAHEEGCHGGFNKTLFRIRQKYFWPNMALEVKSFIGQCDTCKIIKPTNQILRPPMGSQILTTRPFQRLYMGPYPCLRSKNCQLFIAIDHLTKFLFLKPLKSATYRFFQNELFFHLRGAAIYTY